MNNKEDTKNHRSYIACVVKAWRDATIMYSEIFEELVQLTAENKSEGRGPLEGHYQLMELLNGAYAAYKPTANYSLEDNIPESQGPESGDKRSASPYPTRAKRSRMESEGSVQPPIFEQENAHPEVQFEDILAEVEARLRAKEERKKAKKAEKKRKRESLDSAFEPPTPGTLSSEKPTKKKARSETESTPAMAKTGVAEKRRSDSNDLSDLVRRHKKRKKHVPL